MQDTKELKPLHKKSADFIHRVLHAIERIIAFMTLFVLIGMLGLELYKLGLDIQKMTVTPDYFISLNNYLNNVLTIVVGLEFVRMLLDMTPANTLEVLIVAISRQVILSHDNPLGNVACVLCIAGLFAIRRYLIRRSELKEEMVETE